MALIAPSVARYTINGTYLGRPTANIIDMFIVQEVGILDRDDRVAQLAEFIRVQWNDRILPAQSTSFTAESVSWVDMNSVDGTVGVVTGSGGTAWPNQGETGGNPYSGSVAALITKQAVARRGQRQGRMFLPGLSESYVSGNELDATWLNPLNGQLAQFVADLSATDVLPFEGFYPCVTHTRNDGTPTNPDIVFNGTSRVVSMAVEVQVASQRRRNRP